MLGPIHASMIRTCMNLLETCRLDCQKISPNRAWACKIPRRSYSTHRAIPICLIICHFDPQGHRRLLVAANRDEHYERATEPLHRWDSGMLAGRDAVAGGTWLGVSGRRFAAVTNIAGQARPDAKRSRGELVTAFLNSSQSAETFANRLKTAMGDYSGFNLLMFDGSALWLIGQDDLVPTRLRPGTHVVTNHPASDREWPKTQHARERFGQLDSPGAAELFSLLASEASATPAADEGAVRDYMMTSLFIRTPLYGTRSSSVVQLFADRGEITELGYDSHGQPSGRTRLEWVPDA